MAGYRYPIPASFFGMVLGLAGLGNAWRVAARVWLLPAMVGETILALTALLWLSLVAMYLGKWLFARAAARAEFDHEIQSGFIALLPLTTMLMALAVAPYSHVAAVGLWVAGVLGQLGFGVFSTGRLWQGGRDPMAPTPVLYLPTVGTNLVAALVAGNLGYPELGALFFGAGALAWLSLESVIVQRYMSGTAIPVQMRAVLGIQFAPPVVSAMAYLAITTGIPDVFVHALLGYGVFQAMLMLRLIPWFKQQGFGAGAWAFTFGITAIATVPLRMLERGGTWQLTLLAWPFFVFANCFIAALAARTAYLAWQGRLLPQQVGVAKPAPTSAEHQPQAQG